MTRQGIHHILAYMAAAVIALLAASCSQTRNMPEGELLYKGIKEISYGEKAASARQIVTQREDEGVITSVGNAVNTVSSLLSRRKGVLETLDSLKVRQKDKSLTREQLDSIKAEAELLNTAFEEAKAEVEAALACAPNGALMGSSKIVFPWPIGLYVHNYLADSKSAVGKWINNTFGRSPVYISTVNPHTRTLVAKNILRNHGFFRAETEYDLIPMKDSLKAKIAYSVYPNQLYRLGSIEFLQFPARVDSIITKGRRQSGLKTGDAFNVANLDAERTRISTLLKNRGYYAFRPEYVTFKADTIRQPGRVQLRVEPIPGLPQNAMRQYVIGHTDVTMLKYDDYVIVDSVRPRKRSRDTISVDTTKSRKSRTLPRVRDIMMRYSGKAGVQPLRLSELRKYLFYTEGQMYNETMLSYVRDKVGQMGIFSQLQMNFTPRNSTDSLAPDTLDVHILAMLDKPYDSEFSASITNKSNGLIGPGISYSISKKNAFHRAETMKLMVYGSYEWQTGATPTGNNGTVNSFELGGQLSLNYPRLIMPNGRRIGRSAKTSTDYALDISWINRAGYYSMAQFKADMTYNYQGRMYVRHSFTPLSVKYTSLLKRSESLDEIFRRNPIIEVSMRDQVVPSMEYTLSMTSSRRARNPRSFTMTIKQAGNITSGIFAAFGKNWSEKDKKILGAPFAQFVKLTADFKEEVRLPHDMSIVGRVSAGVIYSYGNSSAAPYSDLFSVGGANSIRAFCLRGVGPGRYHPSNNGYSYIDQMGDIKLELNAELRFPIIGNLKGALFIDAGNVWLMKEDANRPGSGFSLKHFANDLALGTGAGVRYDLSFLVLRFDIGVGIHTPYDTGKSGYYNMPNFGKSLGFHLAVGYPF